MRCAGSTKRARFIDADFEYDDRLTITTPEGVELSLTLAGVGSRFIAAPRRRARSRRPCSIALALLVFLSDGFGAGVERRRGDLRGRRLPRLLGLRRRVRGARLGPDAGQALERPSGRPLRRAADRLPRERDAQPAPPDRLPAVAVPGRHRSRSSSTGKNQRLGDIVAGTVVVRERARRDVSGRHRRAVTPPDSASSVAWDVSAITAEETRRRAQLPRTPHDIDSTARHELAATIAARLRPKVAGAAGLPERGVPRAARASRSRARG